MALVNVTFLQGRTFGVAYIPAGTTGDMDEDEARGLGGSVVKINGPATGVPVLSPVSGESNISRRGGSRLQAGKPWMRSPSSAAAFTALAGATVQVVQRRGRAALEITYAASATVQNVYFSIASGTVSQQQHMTIEVEDAAEWNGGSWRLGFYTDNTFSNGVRHVHSVGSVTGYSGIHEIAPLATEWANVGTGSFSSTMTYCMIGGGRKASPTTTTRIWVYEVAEGEKNSLPSIIIGADDGHMTWYTDGLPVLEKYGFSSYLAYIHDEQNGTTRMRANVEWADAIARGHHAVVHGCKTGVSSLRDYFSSYSGYASPYAAIYADITYNRDGMVAAGLDPDGRGRKFYVLPQGFHQPSGGAGDNTILSALQAAGMTAGRIAAVSNAIIGNGGWSGASMYLPIIGHSYAGGSESTNISNLITQMQTEIAAGRSVILMHHEVRASPTVAEQITPANLELLVAAADALVRSGAARKGKLTDIASELSTYTAPVHVGQ